MNMFSQQQTPDDIDMMYSALEKMDLSDDIDSRKRHRDPNSDPNTRKQMKPSGPENKNTSP